MTVAPSNGPSGAGPMSLFSMFSSQSNDPFRTRREAFVFSLVGQGIILALLTYFTCCVIDGPPKLLGQFPKADDLPLIFSGNSGGGGGGFDKLPPSQGNIPRASLAEQLTPPTVIVPREMPKLPVEETVIVAPDVRFPQGGQIGDPMSRFTQALSNGPGGPGGTGTGCCDGVGDSVGPHAGSGPPGIYPAGRGGVTVPQVIYNPEPSFSEEARKAKQQGIVQLLLVVGKDGRTYDIRVAQTLGMGLDEKAIEAVSQWRFKPATLNGQAVATRIMVEVQFHLY
jgi:periplasmic protein TonB